MNKKVCINILNRISPSPFRNRCSAVIQSYFPAILSTDQNVLPRVQRLGCIAIIWLLCCLSHLLQTDHSALQVTKVCG
jgi:hypothetical protein